MPDFSNLAVLDVNATTEVEYTFGLIPGEPSIWLAPMTDDNVPYLNARLKLAAERAAEATEKAKKRRGRTGRAPALPEFTADDLEQDRELEREHLAKFCCRRWGTAPRDVKGEQPEFSEENCLAFLRALPNYMIDPFRNFARNVANFIPKVGDDFLPVSDEDRDALGNS